MNQPQVLPWRLQHRVQQPRTDLQADLMCADTLKQRFAAFMCRTSTDCFKYNSSGCTLKIRWQQKQRVQVHQSPTENKISSGTAVMHLLVCVFTIRLESVCLFNTFFQQCKDRPHHWCIGGSDAGCTLQQHPNTCIRNFLVPHVYFFPPFFSFPSPSRMLSQIF